MEILKTISFYAKKEEMKFLLIGGHAVNAYGISRQTGDIDLLVPREDKDQWEKLLNKLKYKSDQNDDRFARFAPDTALAWPIDLMFVDKETFTKMFVDSVPFEIGEAMIKVVSARHLATLKIHALKQYQEHRYLKDFNDLVALIKSNKTGITDEELKLLCEKYADVSLYEKLKMQRAI